MGLAYQNNLKRTRILCAFDSFTQIV
jgi:hypothetical protein